MPTLFAALLLGATLAPQQPVRFDVVTIEGVVLGTDLQPVANGEVWVGDDPSPRTRTRTDGSGRFMIATERRQFVAVHARREGDAVGAVWVDGAVPGRPFVRVALLPSRPLEGVVRTPDGEPVADAFVTAAANDLADVALSCVPARTDAAGRYRIDAVVRGPIRVRATKPGFGAARVDDDGRAATVDLELDPDLRRSLTVSLAGAGSEVAARAAVRLLAEQDSMPVPLPQELTLGRFDADGRCTFAGLPVGARIHVEIDAKDAWIEPACDFVPSTVREWEIAAKVVPVPDSARLRGRLVDARGTGVRGVAVAAFPAGGDWQQQRFAGTVSGDDGAFELWVRGATDGTAWVTVLDDAIAVAVEQPAVALGGDAAVPIVVRAPRRFQARLVDAEDRPVVGALVDTVASWTQSAVTDLDGRLRFLDRSGTAREPLELWIADPKGGCKLSFVITGDLDQDLGTLRLSPGGEVHGIALDADGKPVPGARVWLNGNSRALTTHLQIADGDGRYRFAVLPEEVYYLDASATGMADFTTMIEVRTGDVIRRDSLVQ